MSSIRRTLSLRLLGGALVLMVASALLLRWGVGWLLTEQFDEALRTKLATFTTLLEQEGYNIELAFVEQAMPEYSAAEEPEYVEIRLFEGESLYRSPSLGDDHLPVLLGTEAEPAIRDLELPDGRSGRAIGAEFTVHVYEPGLEDPGPAHLVLVLARGREPLDRAFALLLGGTVLGAALLSLAALVVGRSAVTRGLVPVEDMARRVEAIRDPSQAPRLAEGAVPDELAPLAVSHNELLDRVERAFERERRITANIAHELRTPIAELAILTDPAGWSSEDRVETARRLEELRELGGQMSALISTLIQIARMESGSVPLEIEEIDLADLVRRSWEPVESAATRKQLAFRPPGGRGPVVRADRVALSILLANLLDNAVEHSVPDGEIECELAGTNGRGRLVIANPIDGPPPEDLERLKEPFSRARPTRSDRLHAGLGLSLVSRLAALLELELSLRVEGRRFVVEVGFETA